MISDEEFLIQLIVTSRLFEKDNLWLKNLTNDLKESETVLKLIEDYKKHEAEGLYQSVMDIIVRANEERFQEVDNMCEALEELLKDKIEAKTKKAEQEAMERGMAEGEKNKLLSLIQKKLVKGKTIAQIADELEETEETILPLCNLLMEESAEYKSIN